MEHLRILQFQTPLLEAQFSSKEVDTRIRMLYLLVCAYSIDCFGKSLIVTSILRPGDLGVHGVGRGLDCDNDLLKDFEMKQIEIYINSLFSYDTIRPKMKVCIYHTVEGRGGDHIHLQVHPHTELYYVST